MCLDTCTPCLVALDRLHSFASWAVFISTVWKPVWERKGKNTVDQEPFPHLCSQNTKKIIRGILELYLGDCILGISLPHFHN